jgi:hypothetical protein
MTLVTPRYDAPTHRREEGDVDPQDIRVLVVEDDDAVRMLFVTALERLGLGGVTTATDPDVAIARVRADQPELVLLYDVSGSMRAFARLALEFSYALSVHFSRVRAFVFVDALDEVTHAFAESSSLQHALERVDREAQVVDVDGQSWYGRCLDQFWDRPAGTSHCTARCS